MNIILSISAVLSIAYLVFITKDRYKALNIKGEFALSTILFFYFLLLTPYIYIFWK